MESEKVLNLRNFLSVPKPATEKIDTNFDIDSVTRTFVEAVQLTSEERGGLENTENTANKHAVPDTNRTEEPEENVQTDNIITESRHQKEAPVEEASTFVDVRENEKVVVTKNEVTEEKGTEAVKEEKSVPAGQEENAIQNEEVESDEEESDSSSDSDSSSSSSSSSSSDSESDNDERDDLSRIRLDQVNKHKQLLSETIVHKSNVLGSFARFE